jgi:hypothetical protein
MVQPENDEIVFQFLSYSHLQMLPLVMQGGVDTLFSNFTNLFKVPPTMSQEEVFRMLFIAPNRITFGGSETEVTVPRNRSIAFCLDITADWLGARLRQGEVCCP